MQLFEVFEYLFNRDQPGDWDAICLYFASHKPLHSPVIKASAAPRVSAYPSHHSPDHRTGAAAGASLDCDIWSRYNDGRQMHRTVSWVLDFLSLLLWIQL